MSRPQRFCTQLAGTPLSVFVSSQQSEVNLPADRPHCTCAGPHGLTRNKLPGMHSGAQRPGELAVWKQAGAAAASSPALMTSSTGPECPDQELSPEALWQRIEAAYSRAEASGAAYRRGPDAKLAGTAA